MERNAEPNLNLKAYLADAYLHPIFHSVEDLEAGEIRIDKNQSHVDTPTMSELSSPSPPHYVYHYEVEPWMGGRPSLGWNFRFSARNLGSGHCLLSFCIYFHSWRCKFVGHFTTSVLRMVHFSDQVILEKCMRWVPWLIAVIQIVRVFIIFLCLFSISVLFPLSIKIV